MTTPRPIFCRCADWRIAATHRRLEMQPSGKTIARNLWVPAVAILLVVVMAWWLGLPPGDYRVSAAHAEVERIEQTIASNAAQASRLRTSPTDAGQRMADALERKRPALEQELRHARDAAANTRATLGIVGNTIYWLLFFGLPLAGAAIPLSGYIERIELYPDESGRLRIRRKWSFGRSTSIELSDYAAITPVARRLIHRSHDPRRITDRGWVWSVILVPDPQRPGVRPLHIDCDWDDTLPTSVERLTLDTRSVLAFLSRVTGLEPSPPVTSDVTNIEADMWGERWKYRTIKHGPVETKPPGSPLV